MLSYLFCSHRFDKIDNYFIFEMLKKKILVSFQRITIFTQKFVTKLSKIWVLDPGSGKKPISDPGSGSGVKKAPEPRSGSSTLENWFLTLPFKFAFNLCYCLVRLVVCIFGQMLITVYCRPSVHASLSQTTHQQHPFFQLES